MQLMDYAQSRSCFMSDNMYTLEGVCTQIVTRLWDLKRKGGGGVAGGWGGGEVERGECINKQTNE